MTKMIVGLIEEVNILGKKQMKIPAKFDTGAKYTSIDKGLAKEMGLASSEKKIRIKSSLSRGEMRSVTEIKIEIHGKIYETMANISDRSHMRYKILIGRDLIYGNFLIDVSKGRKSK